MLEETEFDVGSVHDIETNAKLYISTTLLPCHSRSRMKSRQQDGRPDENPSNQSGIQPEPTARLGCVLLRRTQLRTFKSSQTKKQKGKLTEN